ncbi:hypothetical protein PCASD_09365 [Puccinia coronata f. sp. avenae]|uniref:DNA 3'-5' helicase n=1 Tax=Puccinia coronata f. sp. avenae TaxID=200324 RepID=A0A2N5V189_9BASI|nr:hypothetical protein PCASD_09365 [Puccinia coronata f. sp. avenae]
MTLNFETVLKIKKGHYSFVYLSPEVFLNSSLFTDLFFSSEFQNSLVLITVDEAHMIYLWGLVESRESKTTNSFDRQQDQGVFRPSYGSMAVRLMATNNVPLLLLSATCGPQAVDAIRSNLMLQPEDITMVNGELTRPEIRIIRVMMKSTLKSCNDLLSFYAPHTHIPANQTVPTIIYSGTRNATFQVMKVINEARHTKKHEFDPTDPFIRRFHSVTGDEDKLDNMEDYSANQFPLMSATMALGLGQNLKRVRLVIHMGRGDPSCIIQMIGRCGRDGNTGLAFILMEPTRKNGKNSLADFGDLSPNYTADGNMDALAITPVCLRVALTLNSHDPNYIAEQAREIAQGFPACLCSNCAPKEAEAIVALAPQMTVDNMDDILAAPLTIPKDLSILTLQRKRHGNKRKRSCNLPLDAAEILAGHLVKDFEIFFQKMLGLTDEFLASDFFSIKKAKAVVGALDQIIMVTPHDVRLLESVMGGEWFPGQVDAIDQSISNWLDSDYFAGVLLSRMEHEDYIESEILRLRTNMENAAKERKLLSHANTQAKRDLAEVARKEKAQKKLEEKELARRTKVIAAEKATKEKEETRLCLEEAKKKQAEEAQAKSDERERVACLKKKEAAIAAAAKAEERAVRAQEREEERAALAKKKAGEQAKRKEDKEAAKRKASINRENREIRKIRKTVLLHNTAMTLALHNASGDSSMESASMANLDFPIDPNLVDVLTPKQ